MDDEAVRAAKADLTEATKRYRRADTARKAASQAAIDRALALLRLDVGPSEVARLSPFTDAYIRKLARLAGIPPARATGYARPEGKSRT